MQLKKNLGTDSPWGAGVDTSARCRLVRRSRFAKRVRQGLEVFGAGDGFGFNPVHNVQSRAALENTPALHATVREFSHP
jgi:hypothetical protein